MKKTMEELAKKIAERICVRPAAIIKGQCLCSMSSGETCSVCVPSRLDEERVADLVLEVLSEE